MKEGNVDLEDPPLNNSQENQQQNKILCVIKARLK